MDGSGYEGKSGLGPPIGASLPRLVTKRLLQGRGRYVDDIVLPRMAHLAFLRSPHARADIRDIAVEEARRIPGVLGVYTAADLRKVCDAWTGTGATFAGFSPPEQFALAEHAAYYHGEPVVAVLAETRALAEDGVDRVAIDWDPKPASPDLAATPDAPPVHPTLTDNIGFRARIGDGDFAALCRDAACVVEDHFTFARQTGATMETRGLIADFEPGERSLTLHHSHQVPHEMQALFARLLRLDQHRVRVVCPDVGGGFGVKLHLYSDEVATAAVALLAGRPVKFIADRGEAFLADIHAREHQIHARMAVAADGRILGIAIDDLFGMGAYSTAPRTSLSEAMLALRFMGAPYAFDAYDAELRAVFQNRAPTGQYRGVGIPIACMVTERLVDHAGRALGLGPVAMRRRNLLTPEQLPYQSPTGSRLVEIKQHACLERLLELMPWDGLCAERDRLREHGVYRGLGLAAYLEPTAPGPETNGPAGLPVVSGESVTLKIEASGAVRCLSGTTDQGQGTSAGLAQVVAAALGVKVEGVAVITADTGVVPIGGGTWASRGMAVGGEAAYGAAIRLRQEVLGVAGLLLQTAPEALDMVEGILTERATGETRFTLRELAEIVYYRGYLLPGGAQPNFALTHHYRRTRDVFVPACGIQASYLELDRDTGKVKLLKHWAVEDCGRIVNPLLVDEQIRGGIVQGIGPALWEACHYDETNGTLRTATLGDYLVPFAPDVPDIVIDHIQTPYSGSVLGAKGVGEAGTCAAGAAVLNAVNDALTPFDAAVTQLPITPATILSALNLL